MREYFEGDAWSLSFWFQLSDTTEFDLQYIWGTKSGVVPKYGRPGFGVSGGARPKPCGALTIPYRTLLYDAVEECGALHVAPYETSEWNHYVVTLERGVYKVYAQGEIVIQTTTVRPFRLDSLVFGRRLFDTYEFNGSIDDIGIWRRALDATEVRRLFEADGPCSFGMSADSILGYRNTETHQVVTYALRNKPDLSYQWFATGGYLLGETTNHFCDVIWGYDDTGWVCCEVRDDSSCLDTLCINIAIQNGTTGGIAQGEGADRIMSVRPNPTVDLLTVSSVEATDATVYDLVDVTGRIVRQAHGRHVTLSTENIPAGVYHLMMKDGKGLVQAIERVVVQR
jgi:hypothetical protein